MAQKTVLGKGLASLLPGAATSAEPAQGMGTGAVAAGPATTTFQQEQSGRIPGITIASVDDIVANQYQPRRDFDEEALAELADSIKTNGIIQPLVVRRGVNGYQLIAGERRLRAAKLAGLKQVPVVIRKSTDREALELALVENIQRKDLNCIDEALAYFQLGQEFALTQEEVAQRVGKDRATVANHLRLLRLPEPVIQDLKSQVLSFGHGKVLLSAETPEACLKARLEIIDKRLSVRDAETLVANLNKGVAPAEVGPTAGGPLSPVKARFSTISQELTRRWSARVEVRGSERRGKIVIHYQTRQELERLLATMQN